MTQNASATSKSFVLLKFEGSWAGEIDLAGFLVVTSAYWQRRQAEIRETKGILRRCVGTNEEMDYEDSEQLLEDIKVTELSQEQVTQLRTLFPLRAYGYSSNKTWKQDIVAGFGDVGFLDNFRVAQEDD